MLDRLDTNDDGAISKDELPQRGRMGQGPGQGMGSGQGMGPGKGMGMSGGRGDCPRAGQN